MNKTQIVVLDKPVLTKISSDTHIYAHTHAHTCTHKHIHAHTCTHTTHTHMHTQHTHTHTHTTHNTLKQVNIQKEVFGIHRDCIQTSPRLYAAKASTHQDNQHATTSLTMLVVAGNS